MTQKIVFIIAIILCLSGWGSAQIAGSHRSYSKASSVTTAQQVHTPSATDTEDTEEAEGAEKSGEDEDNEGVEDAAEPGESEDEKDSEEEPEIPTPPPPLVVNVPGDTIYLKRGHAITHVIVLKQGVLKVQYKAFFDHPTNAHTYTASVSILDVDRVEITSKENRAQLQAAWDRKLQQVAAYKEQIKKSGLVLFRGEYVTQSKIDETLKREHDQLAQLRQKQTSRQQSIRQEIQKRAQSVAQQRREQIAASIRPGQNAAVLNLLGPPSSRREMPLFNRIVQTEVIWQDLGIRVIVQNGLIAFIDRFSSRTAGLTPTRQSPAGPAPATATPR